MLITSLIRANSRFKASLLKLPCTACIGTFRSLCTVSVCIRNPLAILQIHTKDSLVSQKRNFRLITPPKNVTFPDCKFSRRGIYGGININPLFREEKRRVNSKLKKIPVGEDVLNTLQTLFGMSLQDSLSMVSSPKLFLIPDAVIMETIWCLRNFKIPRENLLQAPWIVLQPADELTQKMKMLTGSYLFHSHGEGLQFCHFSLHHMQNLQLLFESEREKFPEHKNRVYFFADYFQVPVSEMLKKIIHMPELLTMDVHRIELFFELVEKDYIRREDLFNDLRMLSYSISLAKKRIEILLDAGVKFPKLWLLRCDDIRFSKYISILLEEKNALGENDSIREFLMKRLECTAEELEACASYRRYVARMSPVKADAMIEILLNGGLTKKQILNSLFILRYSHERVETRIRRLKEIGMKNIAAGNFTKTDRTFKDYLRKMEVKMAKKQCL